MHSSFIDIITCKEFGKNILELNTAQIYYST